MWKHSLEISLLLYNQGLIVHVVVLKINFLASTVHNGSMLSLKVGFWLGKVSMIAGTLWTCIHTCVPPHLHKQTDIHHINLISYQWLTGVHYCPWPPCSICFNHVQATHLCCQFLLTLAASFVHSQLAHVLLQ